jgi:meiosis-specific protein
MEELTALVKEWINSRQIGTVNVSDVLSYFPKVSSVSFSYIKSCLYFSFCKFGNSFFV